MRIFLSYGRADSRDLAGRLAADLAARGYAVFTDQRDITAGGSWEEQIEQGILSCDVFLALLSPHAVRRPDGVCLDEISLARYNQRRIVPVMVVLCRPPLGIYRLDWIDFQDWSGAGRYDAGLSRLIESLAAGEARVEGASAQIEGRLRTLDFGAELSRLTRDFTGRAWLLADLAGWLDNGTAPRVFLITGDPGTGKSAVMGHLVDRHPRVAAYHLCVASLTDSLDPVRFVGSIAAQLRTQLPDYRAALEALEFESLAASDAGTLFRRLVADPLRAETPDGPVLLAVDALDEALAFGPRHIARLLAERLDDLPAWLRLVVSSRKDAEVLDLFSRFSPREIDAGRPENLDDVRAYLSRRLAEPGLAARLAGANPADLAARIAAGGSGNFLYVTQAVAAIESGQVDPTGASAFPEGLIGIYQGFFSRLFPVAAEYDAVRPLLEVLTAARAPLSAEEIAAFLGRTAFAVAAELEPLASLFPEREGCYRAFHKSITDWLSGVAGRSRRYRIDRVAGDRSIAHALLANVRAGRYEPYTVNHLPAHLLAAGLLSEAAALLSDLEFLEAKCEAGLTSGLVADFNAALARTDWSEPDRARLGAFARFVQSKSHVLSLRPHLLFAMAANAPDDTPPAAAAQDRLASGRERRTWLRWRNKPQAGQQALVMRLLGTKGFMSCAIAPDGRTIVAGTDEGGLLAWDADTGALGSEIRAHDGGITACAFFPDSRRVLTASNDATLRIWDLHTGAALHTLRGHRRQVNGCAVSPAGNRLASAGEDGRLIVWDASSGDTVRVLDPRDLGLYACAFSPDGRLIASGSRRHEVLVFDTNSGNEVSRLAGHEGEIRCCAFTADGRGLLTGSADDTLRLWDVPSGEARLSIPTGHTGGVNACTFLRDGAWLLSAGSWDSTLRVFDARSGDRLAVLTGHSFWVGACAGHPDDRHAVSASTDMTVCLWDVAAAVQSSNARSADQASPLLGAHAGHACGAEYFAGGTRLVTVSWDGALKIWNADTGEELAVMRPQPEGVRAQSRSPTEVSAFGTVEDGSRRKIYGGSLSPDGRRFVAAGEDGALTVWDLGTFQLEWSWQDGAGPVRSCAVSPDGASLASGGDDGIVRIRTLRGDTVPRSLPGHRSRVTSVRYAPNGRHLVSGSYDGTVRVWDPASGSERFCLASKGELVFATAISPDSTLLAAVSTVEARRRDVMLRVWGIDTGRLRLESVRRALGLDLAFSPDGRWLAYAGFGRQLEILDPADGHTVVEHRSDTKPCSVSWHPSGRRLAVGCINGDVAILEIEQGAARR